VILRTGGSDRLRVLNGGSVGVGAASPSARLHVSSASAVAANTIFKVSTGTSSGQDVFVIRGDGKVGIGLSNPATALNIASGGELRLNDLNNTRYGKMAHSAGGNFHLDTIGGGIMYLNYYGGNGVYVGNGSSTYGPIAASAFNVNSSREVKEDVRPADYGLGEVLKLNAVKFRYKADRNGPGQIGLVAEEVKAVVPEVVSDMDDAGKKTLGIDYGKLAVVLIEAVKTQQREIEESRREIRELRAELRDAVRGR
jgi:hypothetical protein